MGKKITLTINGQTVEAEQGMTILEAAQAAGIYIPAFCAVPGLKPFGACRMCLVEIEKKGGLKESCATFATDGMVVHTESDEVQKARRTILELMVSDHPNGCLICPREERCPPFNVCQREDAVDARCVICSKNGHCELQAAVDYVGLNKFQKHLPSLKRTVPLDLSNPFFQRDLEYCILCGRCVRVCQDVQNVGAIDFVNCGFDTIIAPAAGKMLAESNCIRSDP